MNKGFVMLSRELMFSDEYFSEKFTRMQAFIDLCFLAAFKERTIMKRGKKIILNNKQLAVSERELSCRWKWSVNTVRKYLNELCDLGYIEQEKNNLISVTTIKYGIINQMVPEINQNVLDIDTDNKEILSHKRNKYNALDDLSFVDKEFVGVWKAWLDYKKSNKALYRTSKSAKRAYDKLISLSDNNVDKAVLVVNQSIESNWKGLFPVKEVPKQETLYAILLKRPEWQRKRLEILQRDNFKCAKCGSDKKTLNVHHKYYINGLFPWEYPDDAYITLCEDCHSLEHNIKEK